MIALRGLLLLAAGYGVLRLAARDARLGLVGTLSLAWLAGVAVLAVVTTFAGVLGLPTSRWLVALPLLALALAPVRPRAPGIRKDAALLAGAVTVLAGVRIVSIAAKIPTIHNDEYAIWVLRGRALHALGGLDPGVFANDAALYQHLDYPLLVPALIAWTGGGDGAWHVQVALLAVALLGAVAWGVGRLAGPFAALVAVVSCLVATHFPLLAIRVVADLPAAAYAIAVVLLLLLWLREPEPWQIRLAAVMATGAVHTKNEGAVFVLLACVLAAAVARKLPPLVPLGLAGLTYVPWLVWCRLNGVGNDVVNAEAGDRAALSADRLRDIGAGLVEHWPLPFWWLLLLAGAAALALREGRWREVLVVAGTAAGAVAALAAIYVVTPLEVTSHIDTSAHRVLMFPALLTALATPLLAARQRR